MKNKMMLIKKIKIPCLCIASMLLGAIVAGAVVEYQYEYRYSAGKIAMYSIVRDCVYTIKGHKADFEKIKFNSCMTRKSKEISLYTAQMALVYTYFNCKEKSMTDSECQSDLENIRAEYYYDLNLEDIKISPPGLRK